MENKYIRALRKSQRSISKRLWAAVALLLISSILISSVSYAWLVLSRAPEVSGVTSTIGSNGNLEIALATTEHLEELEQNNMYEPEGKEFIMATGDRVHDNVLWGNLVDLLDIEYGLHTLTMRPAILNVLDGKVAEVPVTVAGYGTDGRLEAFDPDNMDLSQIGVSAIFNSDTARCDFGTVTMTKADLEAGRFDKEAIVEDLLDNVSYGVRQAGPLDYVGRYDQETDNVSVDFYIDGYCFAIDLLLRTNAPMANLMLQTEAVQRMESQLEEEYQGQGSFIELANPYMTAAMSVVFADTLTGEVYAVAQANPEDGKLWITARMDENGDLVETAADDAAMIKPLVQNQVSAITAWVFMNGALVNNASAATQGEMDMKLNLQFSTDAVLNPAYTDIDAEQNYPNRPDMGLNGDSTAPTEPVDPDEPTTPSEPEEPTEEATYYLSQENGSAYSIYTLNSSGARNYELPVTATVNETAKTLTISKVNGYPASGIVIPGQVRMDNADYAVQLGTDDPFANVENTAARVTILEVNGKKVQPTGTSLERLFDDGAYTSIDLRGLDTANVTDMSFMFDCCRVLTTVDVSNLDTANVTYMASMFNSCYELTALDVSNWQTGNVTSMSGMFYECSKLTSLDVSSWDTSEVYDMNSIFYSCTGLTELDVSAWDTGNVMGMPWMFYDCESLTELDVSDWNVGKVTNMDSMFSDCSSLTTLDLSKWNTENVENMRYLFSDCTVLPSVDVSGFKTSKVSDMEAMFDRCENLTYVDVSGFDTANVTNMAWMFYHCKALTSVDVSNFDTANVTNMDCMFTRCSELTSLDVADWNTSKVRYMMDMFRECGKLTSLDFSGWNMSNVGSASFLLDECGKLQTIVTPQAMGSIVIELPGIYKCSADGNIYTVLSISVPVQSTLTKTTGEPSAEPEQPEFFVERSLKTGSLYRLNEDGSKEFENHYSGTTDDVTKTITITSMNYTSNGDVYVPARMTDSETGEVYSVEIDPSVAFMERLVDTTTSVSFVAVDGSKVGITSPCLTYLFKDPDSEESASYKSIDLSGLDTSTANDMSHMFDGFSALTSLNLSGLDTSNVTDMAYMFYYCSNLKSLDVSGFDTANVTNMEEMFANCNSVTSLDVGGFDTSVVTNMEHMFSWCNTLISIEVSNWDTGNVTNMNYLFYNCHDLTSLDTSDWNTENVTGMKYLFNCCSSLTSVDVSNWDTSNVTDMYGTFNKCSALTSLDVSKWNTENVDNMSFMFYDCRGLTQLDVSDWDVGNVTNMDSMFSDCSSMTTLDVSKWNTENVEDMRYLFSDCYALESVDISGFKTSKVTNMESMFDNCEALTYVDVSNFDTSKVTNMSWMFYYCKSLTQLDVSNFDTANVKDMNYMFTRCAKLTSLDVADWNTSKVTKMMSMFKDCEKLTTLDISNWDMDQANTQSMFDNCPAGNNQ